MKLMLVTPTLASQWLQQNIGNRPLRKRTVDLYASQMSSGLWRETHEPIAMDARGNLVDGQHRLAAICKSGKAQRLWVATYDASCDAIDLPIDMGMRRRMSDVLRVDRRATEVAMVLLRVMDYRKVPTLDELRRMLTLLGDAVDVVLNATKKLVKHKRTSASVRAAVVLRCREKPEWAQAIASQYRAFVVGDFNDCWPTLVNLNKQLENETSRVDSSAQHVERDRVARTWRAFDVQDKSRVIRIGDTQAVLDEICDVLTQLGYDK